MAAGSAILVGAAALAPMHCGTERNMQTDGRKLKGRWACVTYINRSTPMLRFSLCRPVGSTQMRPGCSPALGPAAAGGAAVPGWLRQGSEGAVCCDQSRSCGAPFQASLLLPLLLLRRHVLQLALLGVQPGIVVLACRRNVAAEQ